MLTAQRPYGPDAADQWDDGFVAVGRALFRLLPEDIYDRQPLVGSGGKCVLVADIRLDNRDELTSALNIAAAQARNMCDAAILLAAFERWGEALLERIVGDFAFVIWDMERRRFLLARDPVGQRPLHYHRAPGLFAFASMPKGLHALAQVERAPDEERVSEFLLSLPETGSRTNFKTVERVEPGHIVILEAKGLSTRRYWEPPRPAGSPRRAGDYAEAVRWHMDQAVRARLRGAAGAVGTHLSAGLDSSIVSATAAREMDARGGRVVAFTSVPDESFALRPGDTRIADEGPHAAATAARYSNIDHVPIRGDMTSALDMLDRYFFLFEQPVRDLPNGVWVCAINDAARQRKLSVFLPAYMGNLTFSYNGFELLPQDFGSGRWVRWSREIAGVVRNRQMTLMGALGASIGPYISPALWGWLKKTIRGRATGALSQAGINPRQFSQLDMTARARERDMTFEYRPRKDGFATRLWALRRTDMGNINKGTLAGWGIDQRDPTTDRRLVEFCLATPTEQFLSGGVSRALARRAFSDRVPAAVLSESRRGMQGADWYAGTRTLQAQILAEIERLDDCRAAASVLDLARLRTLNETWPQGDGNSGAVTLSHRIVLIRALAVGHFLRKASGSNR
jgi:asparagine synthase (glutamine-hydrolysing)